MGTTTKISFEEFQKLQDAADETVRYELDEGELIVTPSATARHNIARYRLRHALTDFVQKNSLGLVLDETDFLLSPNTVRKPDIAFITKERLNNLDLDKVPIEDSPALAVEVISPSNLAEDTLKKVRQYLAGGSQSVWLVYPLLRVVEIHDVAGIRVLTESEPIREERLFANHTFFFSLSNLFADDPNF
ncbi:MAG TPA: Uma2 family endonuclease [Candidatus Angelobacter sp.]